MCRNVNGDQIIGKWPNGKHNDLDVLLLSCIINEIKAQKRRAYQPVKTDTLSLLVCTTCFEIKNRPVPLESRFESVYIQVGEG